MKKSKAIDKYACPKDQIHTSVLYEISFFHQLHKGPSSFHSFPFTLYHYRYIFVSLNSRIYNKELVN